MLKAALFALLGLALYGTVPGIQLLFILGSFVLLRWGSLIAEARRASLLRHANRRSRQEIWMEGLGVFAFAILVPLDVALLTRDFFSFRAPQGWPGAIVAAVCLVLYVFSHYGIQSPERSNTRVLWWALPFVVALPLLDHAVEKRHPYLNPLNRNHDRLAALSVLALTNNVVAGYHADWVLRYARQLDRNGDDNEAIFFYREGLRLDANDRIAYARLASLEAKEQGLPEPKSSSPVPLRAPYRRSGNPVTRVQRQPIDSQLEKLPGCTVVIVPVGDVSDELIDFVGYVIRNELGLPVIASPDKIALPPYTRLPGVLTGAQWKGEALFQAFRTTTGLLPAAPVRYLLITSVDIYSDEAHYLFSLASWWGALVSSARFNVPSGDTLALQNRTAKQALCAVIKSFGVPVSTDRDCVTSYARSLQEFDKKGDRPDAETLSQLRQAVDSINSKWQRYNAMVRTNQ